jgi:hypothetical protein
VIRTGSGGVSDVVMSVSPPGGTRPSSTIRTVLDRN